VSTTVRAEEVSIPLPPYATRELLSERLQAIFPPGIENRDYCTRALAASTVFVALYIGAVEGGDRDLGPVDVYRMTFEQEALSSEEARHDYYAVMRSRKKHVTGRRWYQDGTREPIRDETLRDGLVAVGAIIRRDDMATTAGLPRYVLKTDFSVLFDPHLTGAALEAAIQAFQEKHLSKTALARVSILLAGAAANDASVTVTFPSRLTRNLAAGPSSFISKAVVEVFATRFLEQPAVLWLSESGKKVVVQDDDIAAQLGLHIEPDKHLPDLILADLGGGQALLVFVEVVATDGAMHERRKQAIYALTDAAGFSREHVALVTAYEDRDSPGYRKTVSQLAWGTFAWFASEPEQLVVLRDGLEQAATLRSLR
jgi:hypothetical protein